MWIKFCEVAFYFKKGPQLFRLLQFNALSFFSNGQNQDEYVTVSPKNSS